MGIRCRCRCLVWVGELAVALVLTMYQCILLFAPCEYPHSFHIAR